jgi:hypothetical protein
MDVDSADASKGESKNAETEAEPVEPLPEIEIYVMLLVMVWLLDQGKLKEVSIPDCASRCERPHLNAGLLSRREPPFRSMLLAICNSSTGGLSINWPPASISTMPDSTSSAVRDQTAWLRSGRPC